jgi:zinc transport system permease protein
MYDFLWLALLAGIGVAAITGPLGSFVVWRRMAYLSDTLSHSALLGVAIAILFSLPVPLMVGLVCIVLAIMLLLFQTRRQISTDTLLGILAHASLALGLFVISFISDVRIDLMAYLFGDLLAVTPRDLAWIYGGGALILGLIIYLWQALLAITVHEELARVEGVPVDRIKLILMLMLALVIAVAMKIVGVLLISALLIIPAATARRMSSTPERMALTASALGIASVVGGLGISYQWDTPAGPSIVVLCFMLFVISLCIPLQKIRS